MASKKAAMSKTEVNIASQVKKLIDDQNEAVILEDVMIEVPAS